MKSYCLVLLVLVCIVTSLTFSNCTHMYYAPNSQNIPMLKEKDDLQLGATQYAGLESQGFNIQAAYAIKDNWALNFNSIYGMGDNNNESGAGFFTEAGGGYFKPLGQHFVAEAYADLGLGNVKNDYGQGLGSSRMAFTRQSIQPSFGFSSKYFDMALSLRLATLYYYSIGATRDINPYDLDDVNFIRDNPFSFLLEPALTIRGGIEPVKLQIQYVISRNMNNPDLKQEVLIGNFGLIVNLGSLVRKHREVKP